MSPCPPRALRVAALAARMVIGPWALVVGALFGAAVLSYAAGVRAECGRIRGVS